MRTTGAAPAASTTPTTTCASPPARSPRAPPARPSHATKSHHHQGVERIGDGLEVTGWATLDDLPEALEVPGNRFTLGVQWHPEADESSPPDRRAGRAGAGVALSAGGVTLTVLEPATEAVLAEIPRAGVEETDAAVARARPPTRAGARSRRPTARGCCYRLADALDAEREALAVLEARNAGKPIGDARGEMGMVVDTFRYYAGAGRAPARRHDPGRRRRGHDLPRAARRRRPDHAVELPAHDRRVEARAVPRRRATRRCSSRRS